jgi:hypothetical protein
MIGWLITFLVVIIILLLLIVLFVVAHINELAEASARSILKHSRL